MQPADDNEAHSFGNEMSGSLTSHTNTGRALRFDFDKLQNSTA